MSTRRTWDQERFEDPRSDLELYGLAEHEDFERGAEDMEHRARRIRAEQEADLEGLQELELADEFKSIDEENDETIANSAFDDDEYCSLCDQHIEDEGHEKDCPNNPDDDDED